MSRRSRRLGVITVVIVAVTAAVAAASATGSGNDWPYSSSAGAPTARPATAVLAAVEVQVPYRATARLDPPVLAVAPVRPPAAFDPPLADHVDDVVTLASPLERAGHPGVSLDPDLFVEPLRHRGLDVIDLTDIDSNICSSGG